MQITVKILNGQEVGLKVCGTSENVFYCGGRTLATSADQFDFISSHVLYKRYFKNSV